MIQHQLRDESSENAHNRFLVFSRDLSSSVPFILDSTTEQALKNVSLYLDEIRSGFSTISIRRNGAIGIRHGLWDFLPLIHEEDPITGGRIDALTSSNGVIPFVEFWFGYPGIALHPLKTINLKKRRLYMAPEKVVLESHRLMDGRVQTCLTGSFGRFVDYFEFPILMQ